MTLGQRIAQKRKELGLSQEALGNQLGVSRQSIYKWESDSSLPEIEKLMALSQIFSVTVGWLLGVEEEPTPNDGNLNQTQLEMVREIVDQYLAAQPKPLSAKRRWIFKAAVGVAGLCLAVGLWNTAQKLDQVTQDYHSLQNSIGNLQHNVNGQISSITSRVESILKNQNQLTAEWDVQHLSSDPASNTATFSLRAVPKTYVEGMTALFVAEDGENTVQLPVQLDADHAFSGTLTVPLTDEEITLSVVFLTGDKRETQLLDSYGGLYSATFPWVMIDYWPLQWEVENNVLPATTDTSRNEPLKVEISAGENNLPAFDPASIELRVGLFQDQKLVMWYEKGLYEYNLNGVLTTEERWFRPQAVTLEPGHAYTQAAVLTDQYGRQYVYADSPITYHETGGEWDTSGQSYQEDSDPSHWEF